MINPRIENMIRQINADISSEKKITDCVEGDIVKFIGGFHMSHENRKRLISDSHAFSVGTLYELRQDYGSRGYTSSYSPKEVHILGTISITRDDAGSTSNGWAAAFFEPA